MAELETSIGFSGVVVDERHVSRVVQRTPKDIVGTGDTELVPAQGAGVRVRLLAMVVRTALATNLRLKSAGNNLSALLALGINDEAVWPYMQHGWLQTEPNEALNMNATVATGGVQLVWIQAQ